MSASRTLQFVSRKYPPAMGGMESYALRLSEELARLTRLSRIVLPGYPDGSTPRPLDLVGFGLKTGLRLLFARHPAEIVHVADMASWPLAWAARLRSRRTRVALSAHGTDVSYGFRPGWKARLYRAYMWTGARLLPDARVICNSQATLELARALGFRNLSRVALASDALDVDHAAAGRRILFAGRLIESKGCAWFIRTVLPALPPDIGMDVAGTVWDPKEGAALDAPRVTYLGKLDRAALGRAYAEALCVVIPNIDVENAPNHEGFGLIAVEAAAAGGIVLASAHSGLKDAVIDGVTGRQLPPGDAGAWVRAISEVASWTPAERAERSARAREAARAHFTWERVAKETLAAYE